MKLFIKYWKLLHYYDITNGLSYIKGEHYVFVIIIVLNSSFVKDSKYFITSYGLLTNVDLKDKGFT